MTARNNSVLRCGVIGVGRMGRHHARVYSQIEGAELVGVVDTNVERRDDVVSEWGGRAFEAVDQLIHEGVDAVTISTPTVHHLAAAERLIEAKVACLIEKPLAPDAQQAAAMAEAAERRGVVLQVGHIVRYDPVMLAIARLQEQGELKRPRFIEVDRISPMTFRSVDVGVVLDMMIHDLDLLLMLVGSEPDEVQASAVSVLGAAEDVCNARLTFHEGGCVANVTASRLALKTERKLRLICEDAYVSADFVARSGTVVRLAANDGHLADIRRRLKAGEDLSGVNYLELVKIDALEVGAGEPLRLQIEDFLDAVRTGRRPAVDAQAGFAAVRTAERVVAAARASGSRRI